MLHLFEIMNNMSLPQNFNFDACSWINYPKNAREDTNMCAVVDRQTLTLLPSVTLL